ncbi:RNA-directed DNA polymerase, eukaryota, reverse transcriptase zinc-binding domain protein, partial [Tanacetum coccineum]
MNGKGEAKFAFQPKKKININVVSKEAKGMPEAMRKVKGIKGDTKEEHGIQGLFTINQEETRISCSNIFELLDDRHAKRALQRKVLDPGLAHRDILKQHLEDKERRELWNDLQIHKRIVSNQAWIIMGDMNVTLNPNEHSARSSRMTSDMNEFKECVKNIEMEDV